MICVFLLFLLFSCSSHYYDDAAALLREGKFEQAEESLPLDPSPLPLLSKAMIDFQSQNYEKSSRTFEQALDAIDYYQQISASEIAGQTLLQDDFGAYVPPIFEQTLARFYQALSFLHQQDEGNAAASLYYLENHLTAKNPLTTYLLATLLERRGDASNAKILLSRLGVESSKGNVLLVHHRGAAPHKKSEIAPASIVSAALLEKLLEIEDVKPALSSLAGVPIPVLHDTTKAWHIQIEADQKPLQPIISYDVKQAAASALEEEMPWIATRAAARLLIRRGLVASSKKNVQPLVDIAMFISNIATQADTRCWTMLPSCIDLYHFELTPGKHELTLGRQTVPLDISSKDLSVIEIFQPKDPS